MAYTLRQLIDMIRTVPDARTALQKLNDKVEGLGGGESNIKNTDQLPEGSNNLYFTPARAKAAVMTETVYSAILPSLLYANGTIQILTLAENGVLTCDIANGQSMTILIPATTHTLDLSGFTIANLFTALSATSLNTLVIFNANGTKYLYGTTGA